METLFIHALQVRARIGVYAWEQALLRPLQLDLALHGDFRAACQSDQLADTLDYDQLSAAIRALAAEQPFALIERFAEAVAHCALGFEPVRRVEVTVTKRGAIPDAATVAFRVVRERQ